MTQVQSIAIPYSGSWTTCGYCSPAGERSEEESSRKQASLIAVRLSCEVYQKMIDRGWRRSGTYCYKPDLKQSCCPQYTIKLDALAMKPSKSHRKLIHRWNRYVLKGEGGDDATEAKAAPQKSKGKDNKPFILADALHSVEGGFLQGESSHRFEVTLEPSSFTQEKFDLYCKYQRDIHNDQHNSPGGFKRFLVESPLAEEPIPYTTSPVPSHLPPSYGSYHQLYRVDGKLIAMAVLDILPNCVSSVYFMYDSLWEHFCFGKLSALREASLAKEIHDAGVPDMKYLYMGFYIYTCKKMRYKGDYSPSFLADPETFEWYPLEKCIPLLQKNRYACFSDESHCIEAEVPEKSPTPEPQSSDMADILVIQRTPSGLYAVPLLTTNYWNNKHARKDFIDVTTALGPELAGSIFWTQ